MQDTFKRINTLDELVEEAAEPTEQKPSQAEQQPVVEDKPIETVVDVDDDDFIDEVEEPMTPKKVKTNTDFILGMINATQEFTFKTGVNFNYKRKLKKLYGDDALEVAETVDDIPIDELSIQQKGIKKMNAKLQKVFEGIPMTADEKEILYPVIEEWVIANQGKIPKNFFIYLGISKMVGARMINVLSF